MEAKRRWSCGDDLTRGACPQSLCARGLKFASMLANNCMNDGNFAMRFAIRKVAGLCGDLSVIKRSILFITSLGQKQG